MRPSHCAATSCDPSLARTSPQAGGHLIRLVVECAFGLLSSQWRMYRRVISVKAAKAEDCVKATCILHNLLHWETKEDQDHPTLSSVEQCAVQHLDRLGSNNASREAQAVRENFTTYFSSPAGAVDWQDDII